MNNINKEVPAEIYIVDIYAVYSGGDGYRSGNPRYFTLSKDAAYQYAVGRGWYGGHAHVSKFSSLKIKDKYYILYFDKSLQFATQTDIVDIEQKSKREQALAKLTHEDKELLGLI